jgi:hypothetical protein
MPTGHPKNPGAIRCRTCGHTFAGKRELSLHQFKAHKKGPLARLHSPQMKRALSKVVRAPAVQSGYIPRPKGASFDKEAPWNLGLIDALNMARKSIERSLEILGG